MSGEEGKTLARRYFEEVINQGNLAVADQIFAADYIDHSARPGSPTGPVAVKPVVAAFRAAFHELDETIEDMVAEGDKVALRFRAAGVHRGEFRGIAPTGRRVQWTGLAILRVAGGKIVERWGVIDVFSIIQQLG
jgi:predicted ester cyclase